MGGRNPRVQLHFNLNPELRVWKSDKNKSARTKTSEGAEATGMKVCRLWNRCILHKEHSSQGQSQTDVWSLDHTDCHNSTTLPLWCERRLRQFTMNGCSYVLIKLYQNRRLAGRVQFATSCWKFAGLGTKPKPLGEETQKQSSFELRVEEGFRNWHKRPCDIILEENYLWACN